MSTENVPVDDEPATGRRPTPFEPEHLSLVPVVGAIAAIASGIEHGWTIATMFLALAYLGTYARSRRQ